MHKKAMWFLGVCLALSSLAAAQSLGDLAREERQKQQAKNGQTPKVITNDDLPASATLSLDQGKERNNGPSKPLGSKSAEQWKSQIVAQKKAVANLQSQIDHTNSSIHYVESARYWNAVQHNQRQEQKQEQVEVMRTRLVDEQKKLEDLQEACRREGFGSSVYDPN